VAARHTCKRWRLALRCVFGATAGVLVLALMSPGWAQQSAQTAPQSVPGTVTTDTRAKLEAERLAEEAERRRLLEGRDVGFEEILANPDDIDLNFAYAETQIRKGDVRGAGATLERILLVEPDLPRVRLLYAIVQFRLENLEEAERELKNVRDLEMPDELRRSIDDYLKQIDQKRQRLRWGVYASIGGQYDTNRNAAPKSRRNLLFGIDTDVQGQSNPIDDFAIQGITRFEGNYDLGFQAKHDVFGSVTYYHAQQAQLGRLDIRSSTIEAGGNIDLTPTTITPVYYERFLRLARQNYLHARGARIRATEQLVQGWSAYAEFQGEDQKYRNISSDQSARLRQGPQWEGSFGTDYVLSPTMRINLEMRYTVKEAREKYNMYTQKQWSISHVWLLGDGMFLLSSFTHQRDTYDDPDLLLGDVTRRDEGYRGRITYGLPLTYVTGEDGLIGRLLEGVNLTASFEYYRSGSNITNYTYDSKKYGIALSKRWDF
jgi:hypothetical protein